MEREEGFGFAATLMGEHSGFGTFRWFGSEQGLKATRCPESRPLSATYFTHPPPPLQALLILTSSFLLTPLSLLSLSTFPLSCSPLISRLLSLKLSLRQSAYKFRGRISNSKLLNNQTFLSKVLLKMKAKSFTKKGFLFKTEINSLETIRGGQFNNGVDILTKEALCITPKIFWCDFD